MVPLGVRPNPAEHRLAVAGGVPCGVLLAPSPIQNSYLLKSYHLRRKILEKKSSANSEVPSECNVGAKCRAQRAARRRGPADLSTRQFIIPLNRKRPLPTGPSSDETMTTVEDDIRRVLSGTCPRNQSAEVEEANAMSRSQVCACATPCLPIHPLLAHDSHLLWT